MTETKFYPEILRHKLSIKNKVIRCFLGELFGTFLLIFIGECIIAQFILSHEKLNTWIQINIGWGLDVTFAAQCVTKVSGGHLNPAVSVMLFSFGEIDLFTLGYYVVAQNIGAFLGGAATYGLYIGASFRFILL
ncbi:hypothetical protein AB6A40_007118 [Gnathostoma spinigerum]|uniref:Aquaporin n=1 Tax=Gnathostoma spinigerum TaxID=75299 RepID=A0ABD6EQF0_9BILA